MSDSNIDLVMRSSSDLTFNPCLGICSVQGTTPSPYEAAAQLKKKRDTDGMSNGQDWRWEVNKRQKVHSLFCLSPALIPFHA